jgi:hypothetical protein
MPSTPSNPLTLYRVDLERTIYVMASSRREAEQVAVRNEREEVGGGDPSAYASEENYLFLVPEEWQDSIPYVPYGAEQDERTVRAILTDRANGGDTPQPTS